MKKTMTIAMALSLFGSIAVFADGNQGNGNRTNNCTDPADCPPAVCTQGCDAPMAMPTVPTDDNSVLSDVSDVVTDAVLGTVDLVLF